MAAPDTLRKYSLAGGKKKRKELTAPLALPCARYRGGRSWTGSQHVAAAALDSHGLGLASATPAAGSSSIFLRPSTLTCETMSTLPTSTVAEAMTTRVRVPGRARPMVGAPEIPAPASRNLQFTEREKVKYQEKSSRQPTREVAE